jgi:hypothetical protein
MRKRAAIGRPLIVAASIAGGFGVVWAIVVCFLGALVEDLTRPRRSYQDITVLADGTPLVRTVTYGRWSMETFATLAGKPVTPKQHAPLYGTQLAARARRHGRWQPDPNWFARMQVVAEGDFQPEIAWFLVPDTGPTATACFEGYDLRTNMCVGYVGRRGFCQAKPPADGRFVIHGEDLVRYGSSSAVFLRNHGWLAYAAPESKAADSRNTLVYLLAGDELLAVNLHERSVRLVRKAADIRSMGVIELCGNFEGEPVRQQHGAAPFLALRTETDIVLTDIDAKQLGRFVIPEPLRGHEFSLFLLDETHALAQESQRLSRAGVERHCFTWFDNQGRVEKTDSVDLRSNRLMMSAAWFATVAAPVPAGVTPLAIFGSARDYVRSGECADYRSAMVAAASDYWPLVVAVNLVGLVLAVVCYRRQRRYAQGWTWVWVGFVFLFGLPGLVGYLTHRRWPTLAPCPSCRAAAPRDREACSVCRQGFPRPAAKGTEVFA